MQGTVAGANRGTRQKPRKLAPLSRTRLTRLKRDAEAHGLVARVAKLRRVSLRSVLDCVKLADLAAGRLPKKVAKLLDSPDAWSPR